MCITSCLSALDLPPAHSSSRSASRHPSSFFFFNDTATTEIYTLSLHDALPIYRAARDRAYGSSCSRARATAHLWFQRKDRKSTRLNSSHSQISYAVFCLKKKTKSRIETAVSSRCDVWESAVPRDTGVRVTSLVR